MFFPCEKSAETATLSRARSNQAPIPDALQLGVLSYSSLGFSPLPAFVQVSHDRSLPQAESVWT